MEYLLYVVLVWLLAPARHAREIQKDIILEERPTIQCALPQLPKRVQYRANHEGNRLFYRCQRGYKTLGEVFSICDDATWSSPPPTCIARGCKMIYHVTHGRVAIGYGGAMARVTCDKDYKMQGSNVIVCDGNEWNSTIPTCTDSSDSSRGGRIAYGHSGHHAKSHNEWLLESDYSCIKRKGSVRPPTIDNTQYTTQWAILEGKPRLYTLYRCKWGFVSKGKAKHMYCKHGAWTGGLPKCVHAATTSAPAIPRDQSDPTKMTHADWLMKSDYTCMGSREIPQQLKPKPTSSGRYILRYDVIEGMPRLYAELLCDHGYSSHDNQKHVYCKDRTWLGPEQRCVMAINEIDACADNNGGCQHVCRNNRGSYSCQCHDGYLLADDGRSCKKTTTWSSRGDLVAPMALFHQ